MTATGHGFEVSFDRFLCKISFEEGEPNPHQYGYFHFSRKEVQVYERMKQGIMEGGGIPG